MRKNLVVLLSSCAIAFAAGAGAEAANAPLSCTIQTFTGNYLTAVGGGGRTTDVLHTDATHAASWERFLMVDVGEGSGEYGFQTKNGNYLTAVGGGGRTTDVFHTHGTHLQAWEKIHVNSLGNGWYSLGTHTGNYITAVGGGGRTTDVLHTDATHVDSWEKFRLHCRHP